MTDLQRAVAFEEALRDRCAERIVPFEWGTAVFNESLPRVWDLNVLRVDRPGGATAEALSAEADRLQGRAGLLHRRVSIVGEAAGAELAPGFHALGWTVNRFLYMAHSRPAARPADLGLVREVDRAAVEPLRKEVIREQPWGRDPQVVRQMVAAGRLVAAAGNARHFAVVVDGVVASCADLYSDGKTGQVEDVATLAAHRGRGYATAVVLRALEESVRGGHTLIFLVADDEDWPKELYARLGFDPLGRRYVFLKPPATRAPAGRRRATADLSKRAGRGRPRARSGRARPPS
jgi:GNAT superfamily N-acetyltransferase